MNHKLPLVVILGATGCGKSRLAIDLAKRFGGEIISADSMQVYKGLDIVTNKVSKEELLQAKHHMMNLVDPLNNYSVVDFQSRSLDIIDSLHKRNSLPIVVGGTNYYIESILWKSFLIANESKEAEFSREEDSTNSTTMIDNEVKIFSNLTKESVHSVEDCLEVEKFFEKPIYFSSFKDMDSEYLWKILEQVDPETAHKYHPKNRRAIIRFLQIYQNRGTTYSQLLKMQNKSSQDGKTSLGGPLRFENTCVIWLQCEDSLLHEFVDRRVDQMLERGLLAELESFHVLYNEQRILASQNSEYKLGIFQTIGFKEFHAYLILDSNVKTSEEGKKILESCIKEMKLSTKRYIKRQMKWIRSRFLREGLRDLPSIFKLTTSFDEEDWTPQVKEPAFNIVESFIENKSLDNKFLSYKAESQKDFVRFEAGKLYCEACDRTFIGNTDITNHLASKRHKRAEDQRNRKKRQLEDGADSEPQRIKLDDNESCTITISTSCEGNGLY